MAVKKEPKISLDVAQADFEANCDYLQISTDLDPNRSEDMNASLEDYKHKIIKGIQLGNIVKTEQSLLSFNIPTESGIEAYTFREPITRDFKAMDKNKAGEDIAKTLSFIRSCTSIPAPVLDRCPIRITNLLIAYTNYLLGNL